MYQNVQKCRSNIIPYISMSIWIEDSSLGVQQICSHGHGRSDTWKHRYIPGWSVGIHKHFERKFPCSGQSVPATQRGRPEAETCQIWPFTAKVIYLGHELSSEGIGLPAAYIEKTCTWPTPETNRGVTRMLGVFGYYRAFLPDFAKLTTPMNSLRNSE